MKYMDISLGKARDLSGQDFKFFKVLRVDKKYRDSASRIYWLCECKECGVLCSVNGTYILSGHTKSCGCLKRRGGNNNPNWRGCGELSQDKFREIKHGARVRNIDFKISIEQLWNLFLQQNRKCALTDLDLHLDRNRHKNIRENASLDRIDSSEPYVIHNIRWLHKDVNLMKNVLSDARLFELCSLLLTKRQG